MIPVSQGIYTRENVWGLPRWDPTLLWYAKAVGALWPMAINDPTSWRYQAAIHGYGPMDDPSEPDPLGKPGEVMPADRTTYWHQCQHGTWYFLPWHRGYVGYFEKLVRKTIVDLGGPADWALPFWNYSDLSEASARYMRPEFLEQSLPDGSLNPLFNHIQRGRHDTVATPVGQAGDFGIGPRKFSLDCLAQRVFNDSAPALDFGGTASGFLHEGGGPGALELVPHGSIHNAVGEWMADFNTAALDPIFWLHHSNVDRLWEVWLAQTDFRRRNPSDAAWLSPVGAGVPFQLHDENGAPTTFVPNDVLDTRSALFSYQYQGLAAPATANVGQPQALLDLVTPVAPKLVAASAPAIDLTKTQSIAVRFDPKGPALSLRENANVEHAEHAYLNFENVNGSGTLIAHYAYLDLPPGADPQASEAHYAGLLPMFGVREASGRRASHPKSGINFVLDVTKIIERLKTLGAWEETAFTVTLVPDRPLPQGSTLRIGRVSLYYR